jgi:hypothetical protein
LGTACHGGPHPEGLPLLRTYPLPRVLPPLPRWDSPVRSSLASQEASAFPVIMAGRLPHWRSRGLLGVHCSLQPARLADLPKEAFLLECFSPFVSS